MTVIAVDWSGARKPRGIWLAAIRAGELIESRACTTREEAVDAVIATPSPVVAGFDFSFSVPTWFAHELGCNTVDEVWERAAADGERWLTPIAPFWRSRCDLPVDRRFRRCEEALRTAKSIFQLVGNGQVGAGSVRGMPLLTHLRYSGFAIWPFDAASDRTAVEIYPTVLRRQVGDLGPFTTNDERDAVCSVYAMWNRRDELRRLAAADDPTTLLEGDVALSDR